MTDRSWVGGSFRDPHGRLFEHEGTLYREVRSSYASRYRALMDSGLYGRLVGDDLLVAHEEVDDPPPSAPDARVVRPERIPFVSYPYEWTFSALRAAALLTLDVQLAALEHGMVLKDASAFNVQFRGTAPVFIDTLSFDHHEEGEPWRAYRQFCRHFLAPLAVGAHAGWTVRGLWRSELDGVPLPFASRALPLRSWLKPSLLMHLHLHALGEEKLSAAGRSLGRGSGRMSRGRLEELCRSLRRAVEGLDYEPGDTVWSDYYDACDHYPDGALERKEAAVVRVLDRTEPDTVWDLGSNTGRYSRLAADRGARVVAVDADPDAVERHWREARVEGLAVLPLVMDLTNPSPALGWRGRERLSLEERGPADLVLLLAAVHHLRLAGNVPFDEMASWFSELGRWVAVEWVPRDDEKVAALLERRGVEAPDYTETEYRRAFARRFEVVATESLAPSGRRLDLWRAPASRR